MRFCSWLSLLSHDSQIGVFKVNGRFPASSQFVRAVETSKRKSLTSMPARRKEIDVPGGRSSIPLSETSIAAWASWSSAPVFLCPFFQPWLFAFSDILPASLLSFISKKSLSLRNSALKPLALLTTPCKSATCFQLLMRNLDETLSRLSSSLHTTPTSPASS